jgi:hypothetical protein
VLEEVVVVVMVVMVVLVLNGLGLVRSKIVQRRETLEVQVQVQVLVDARRQKICGGARQCADGYERQCSLKLRGMEVEVVVSRVEEVEWVLTTGVCWVRVREVCRCAGVWWFEENSVQHEAEQVPQLLLSLLLSLLPWYLACGSGDDGRVRR